MSRPAIVVFLVSILPLAAEERFPKVVEVSCERLNVRAGIGENYRILTTAQRGDRFVALEERLGWLKVEPTDKIVCWVSKKYVERRADGLGVAKGDRIQLRPTADQNHPPMGQLNKGDTIEILEEQGGWFKVRPPRGAECWAKKEYLKFVANYDDEYRKKAEKEAERQRAEGERIQALARKFADAEAQAQEVARQPVSIQDYSPVIAMYREVAEATPDEMLKRRCEARIQELSTRHEIAVLLREQRAAREQALEELHRQRLEQIREDAERAAAGPPPFAAEGWVDTVGKFIGRPGTHKLIRGGQVICYLTSGTIDLDRYYRRLVGVRGKTSIHPESGEKVIEVEEVEVLGQ